MEAWEKSLNFATEKLKFSKHMKKLLVLAALIAATLPTEAQQVKYTVNGISKNNGTQVKLMNRQTREVITSVVADGKFSFSGMADKDALMAVGEDGCDWATLFFNDGTPVTVNTNDSTLKGSPVNERLVAYDIATNAPVANVQQKYQNLSEAEREKKQTEIVGAMMIAVMKMGDQLSKIFKEENKTMIPAAFISEYQQVFGQEKLDSIIATKPVWASHPLVKQQVQLWAQMKAQDEKKNAFIGQQFTDLEEADPDGNMHKLSEYVGKGKWVLVDFWASWCGPCKAEMPNVVAAYEKYHAKGFDIVGLSFDNKKEPWVKDIEALKMPWTHLSDLKGWNTVASTVYGVNSIPDNLLIDPQGKIVARGLRAQALHDKLKEIFGE